MSVHAVCVENAGCIMYALPRNIDWSYTMKKGLYVGIGFLLIIAGLFGCTSMDKAFLGDENNYVKLEPMKLELSYEPIDLRIDAVRRTRAEETSSMQGSQAMVVEIAYMPIGFDLGNGVFIDTNFNVGLDIAELFGIDENSDFTIIKKHANPLLKNETYVKSGDTYELKTGAAQNTKIEAELTDDGLEISRRPGGNVIVTWEEDVLAVDPAGVLQAIEPHKISGSEDEYMVKIPLKKVFVTREDNSIEFGNRFTVTFDGYVMTFLFEDKREFRLFRIGEDYYFVNEVYSGFHIARDGNVISVTENNRKAYDLVLE